jgi:glycosyltransferase involved in cell wall biosynthesis
VRRKYGLPERFLFYPAQLWPHKNHLALLKALKHLESSTGFRIPLVLTGEKFSSSKPVFSFIGKNSMDYVRYLGKVPLEDLVGLYQNATLLITTTLHESSSLPVLEAAAAGLPIIASRIPPIEEIGRVLRLNFVDPLNPADIASRIHELWHASTTLSEQAAYNRQQSNLFSWKNTAMGYLRLLRRIANGSSEGRTGASTAPDDVAVAVSCGFAVQ